MKAPPVVHRWRCPVCHKPEKLVLACVGESPGRQSVAIPTCACDRSRMRVPPEWRTTEPHAELVDAVRHVALGEPILLEGSHGPCDTLEALFEAWGDLTQPRAFRRNGTGEAAAAPEAPAPSSDADPSTDAAAEESTAPRSRGPVFEAACQYIERGYPIVLLHGVQGEACTCVKGTQCQSAGKHPVGNAWQKRAVRTVEDLQKRWDARHGKPTNIGVLLTDEDRALLIDVDVKANKRGDQTLKQWGQTLGIDFEQYLTQVTPTDGGHYAFRIPEDVDLTV